MKIADVTLYDDFIFALCTFLDDFKSSSDKSGLIRDEPNTDLSERLKYGILASVAHKLANDHNLATPEWTMKEEYTMPYPVYSFDTKSEEYQKFLLETSPNEFACRNIYFGANAIERI